MQYFGSALRFGAAASFCVIVGAAARAGGSPYALTDASRLSEGCFELCGCPQWQAGVAGSFRLIPAGVDGAFEIFEVSDVDWTVLSPPVAISGSGTYRIDRVARVQRLELDLRRGQGDVEHFDSGLVTADVDFPAIHAEVAIHGPPACFDTRFEVHAFSTVAVRGAPWSVIKAIYKQ